MGEPGGMVYYGHDGLNVDSFGLDAETFLALHRQLVALGLEVRQPWPGAQIRFVVYSHALLELGADIGAIISEFNAAQLGDGTDTAHALSLTKLFYHYKLAGADVEVCPTHQTESRPDLKIDGVACELKTRLDQTENRMNRHRHLLFDGRNDEYYDLLIEEIRSPDEDLRRGLLAAEGGFRQADCVFLDLSSHFHSWNYHRLASGIEGGRVKGLYEQPVPPAPRTTILFSPDNALDRNHLAFRPRAFWGYLSVSP